MPDSDSKSAGMTWRIIGGLVLSIAPFVLVASGVQVWFAGTNIHVGIPVHLFGLWLLGYVVFIDVPRWLRNRAEHKAKGELRKE